MKRKKLVVCTVIGLVLCFFVGLGVMAQTNFAAKFPAKKWGKKLSESFQSNAKTNAESNAEKALYAVGKNAQITVDEVELSKYFYILQGMGDKEAEEAALQDLMKKEALYQKACEMGYFVADQEVWDLLAEYKKAMKNADNREELEQIISQFDSEQDFWNYEFAVFSNDMVTQKYVQDLEKAFNEQNKFKDMNEYNSAWHEYFNRIKDDLVNEENFQVVK